MGCTVAELLRRLDSRELSEWMAYYRIEPWGEYRADLRQALTTTVIANAYAPKGKRFKVEDFMPIKEPKQPQDWRQMQELFRRNFGNK